MQVPDFLNRFQIALLHCLDQKLKLVHGQLKYLQNI